MCILSVVLLALLDISVSFSIEEISSSSFQVKEGYIKASVDSYT